MTKLDFADIFYKALETSGKSLAQLERELKARGFKINKSTLSRWKDGKTYPDRESILLLREIPGLLNLEAEERTQYLRAISALVGSENAQAKVTHYHNTLGNLPFFTGRDRDLETLSTLLPKQSVIICGLGGIGKTTLAQQFLILQEPHFGQGCEAYKLSAQDTPSQVIEAVAQQLNVPLPANGVTPQNSLATIKEIQKWTAKFEILFLLDNVEEERQVQELLKHLPHIHWVLTSRQRLHLANFYLHHLTPPSPNAATRMLLHYARQPNNPTQKALAKQIAERLGCLPIALYLAGGTLQTGTFASLEELHSWLEREGLQLFKNENDEKDLPSFFEKMLACQPRATQECFILCGAFATWRINRKLFEQTATASGLRPHLLGQLANLSLIQWHPDHQHFELHPLLHEYAALRWQGIAPNAAQQKNFANACAQFAKAHRADHQTLQAALPNLARAVDYAEKQNDWPLLESLWHDLTFHHSELSNWQAYRELDERCLAVARAHQDRKNEGVILLELAWVAYLESRWAEALALCEQAKTLCQQLQLNIDVARACAYQTLIFISEHNFAAAQQQLDEMKTQLALSNEQTASDASPNGVRVRYHYLRTKLYIGLADYHMAVNEAHQGIALAQNFNEPFREKQLLTLLGDALYMLKQPETARDLWNAFDNYNFEKYQKRDPAMQVRLAIETYQQGENTKALRRAYLALRLARQSHKVIIGAQAERLIIAIKAKEPVQELMLAIITA